jgi:hypothetical protein
MTSEWDSEQPRSYLWRLWLGPVGIALSFLIAELFSAQSYGWRGLIKSIPWWSLESAFVFLTAIPVMTTVRAVRISESHLIVRFYAGKQRSFRWDSFRHVSLFEIHHTEDTDGEKHMLRMVPHRGRTVALTDRMSNWDLISRQIQTRVGNVLVGRKSRMERFLWPNRGR